MTVLNEKKCALAILARDCAIKLKRIIPKINSLSTKFKIFDVIIVENDSKDGTKDVLNQWKLTNCNINITILTFDGLFTNSDRIGGAMGRNERMCFFRNKYLDEFESRNINYDYLIVLDADIDDFSVEGLLNVICNCNENWAALFANGRYYTDFFGKRLLGKYYDNYAFVPEESDSMMLNYSQVKLNNDVINHGIKKNSFFKCKSAFTGLAVYKFNIIQGNRYELKKNIHSTYYESLCEHISLHEKIHNTGVYNFFIAREMIVYYEKISLIKYIRALLIRQNIVLFIKKNVLRQRIPI